jgi:hypothetical protein
MTKWLSPSGVGQEVIGTVLVGSVHIDKPGPDAVALAFGYGETLAMDVSADLAVAAFVLVFCSRVRSASSIVELPTHAPEQQCASASTNELVMEEQA